MFRSIHMGSAALALLLIPSSLALAISTTNSGRNPGEGVVAGFDQGSGQGTIELPTLGGDATGILAAMLMSEDGSTRYGADATLTIWIPAGDTPGIMFGGVYGRLYESFGSFEPGTAFKGRLEGNWWMTSDETGALDAAVLADDEAGEPRVIGRVSGKFRVSRERQGPATSPNEPTPPLTGDVGLRFTLAQ